MLTKFTPVRTLIQYDQKALYVYDVKDELFMGNSESLLSLTRGITEKIITAAGDLVPII